MRDAVIREAMTWLGTPYHHRGRLKQIGVDCAQFPLLVYSACGLIEPFDAPDYPADWHLHKSDERYLAAVTARAREIETGQAGPGDFLLFKMGKCFAHGAILIAWPRIIHAVVGHGVMLDEAHSGRLSGKAVKVFTLWD